MMIRVPSRGFDGLGYVGLGQDDGSSDFSGPIDPSGGGFVGPTLPDLSIPSTPLDLSNSPPLTLPIDESGTPFGTCVGAGCGSETGIVASPTDVPLPPTAVSSPTPNQLGRAISQGTGSGLTAAQIATLVGNAANAGVKIMNATSAPYAIPGTNLVYNPATGQIVPTGTSLSTPFGTATLGSSGLLIGGLAVVAVLIVIMSRK
jgi:hypothetical protein